MMNAVPAKGRRESDFDFEGVRWQYNAQQALGMGSVNAVTLATQLMTEAKIWTIDLKAMSPIALALAEQSVKTMSESIRAVSSIGISAVALCCETAETMEGRNTLMEHRAPDFIRYPAMIGGALSIGAARRTGC